MHIGEIISFVTSACKKYMKQSLLGKSKLIIKLGEWRSAPEMLLETVVDMSCNEDSIRASTAAHQQVSCVAYDTELTLRDPSPGNVLSVYHVKNKNSSFVSQSSESQFVNGTGTEAG